MNELRIVTLTISVIVIVIIIVRNIKYCKRISYFVDVAVKWKPSEKSNVVIFLFLLEKSLFHESNFYSSS